MPYSIDDPPEKIKDMPKHAQEIFISAFNAALEQYDGDEARANQVAYAAVKDKYKQDKDEDFDGANIFMHFLNFLYYKIVFINTWFYSKKKFIQNYRILIKQGILMRTDIS